MFKYGRWFHRTRSFWDTQYMYILDYYAIILRLPSTSLRETFGLIARPLPCAHNVYVCVLAHASVFQLRYSDGYGKLCGPDLHRILTRLSDFAIAFAQTIYPFSKIFGIFFTWLFFYKFDPCFGILFCYNFCWGGGECGQNGAHVYRFAV